MALLRRSIRKTLLKMQELAGDVAALVCQAIGIESLPQITSNMIVSHVAGVLTLSLDSLLYTEEQVVNIATYACQANGEVCRFISAGSKNGNNWVKFATVGTVAQGGRGGHSGSDNGMTEAEALTFALDLRTRPVEVLPSADYTVAEVIEATDPAPVTHTRGNRRARAVAR